jgi:DNA-binding response OmpR family regulator
MNILVVEDDARIADFLVRGLRAEGHRVERAATGPEGWPWPSMQHAWCKRASRRRW